MGEAYHRLPITDPPETTRFTPKAAKVFHGPTMSVQKKLKGEARYCVVTSSGMERAIAVGNTVKLGGMAFWMANIFLW